MSAHLRCCSTFHIVCNIVKKIIIAIDGTSSTGKSSIAKKLASKIGYTYIDTGAMYRAVTFLALKNGVFRPDGSIDENTLDSLLGKAKIEFRRNEATSHSDMYLNGENIERDIRGMEVSSHVSPIAAIPFVRRQLVLQQQAMGKAGGIVMDGRDIGTVVFPQAEMKIFITASPEVRAQRRYKELQEKGIPASYDEILKNIHDRDYIDSHRSVSPLKQADDAYLMDNSDMTFDEEMDVLLKIFNDKAR